MGQAAELIRRAWGREGERRRWDEAGMRRAAEESWHPEIVYREAREWPGSSEYRGQEAVLARFREYAELLGTPETEAREILELDDGRVLFTFRYHSEGRGGMPLDNVFAYVFVLRDGLVAEWQAYMDAGTARRELGLA